MTRSGREAWRPRARWPVLRRHLPHDHRRFQYFVCGPPPLMDAMERTLPSLGIPAERIHAERFDMVRGSP